MIYQFRVMSSYTGISYLNPFHKGAFDSYSSLKPNTKFPLVKQTKKGVMDNGLQKNEE